QQFARKNGGFREFASAATTSEMGREAACRGLRRFAEESELSRVIAYDRATDQNGISGVANGNLVSGLSEQIGPGRVRAHPSPVLPSSDNRRCSAPCPRQRTACRQRR